MNAMPPTPYQLHWDNLVAYADRFQRGDAVALTMFAGDVRAVAPDLTDQQIRETCASWSPTRRS